MNDTKARKWKPGVIVRIKSDVRPYGGKTGELRERGERPDGRWQSEAVFRFVDKATDYLLENFPTDTPSRLYDLETSTELRRVE